MMIEYLASLTLYGSHFVVNSSNPILILSFGFCGIVDFWRELLAYAAMSDMSDDGSYSYTYDSDSDLGDDVNATGDGNTDHGAGL